MGVRIVATTMLVLLAAPSWAITLGRVRPQCKGIIGGHGYSNTIDVLAEGFDGLLGGADCLWYVIGNSTGELENLDAGLDDWDDATDTCNTPTTMCQVHVSRFYQRMEGLQGGITYAEPTVLIIHPIWNVTPLGGTHDATDETRLARWIDFMLDAHSEQYPASPVPEIWCMTNAAYTGGNNCKGAVAGDFPAWERSQSLCTWCRDTDGRCDRMIDFGAATGTDIGPLDHHYQDECHPDFPKKRRQAEAMRLLIEATGVVYGPQ